MPRGLAPAQRALPVGDRARLRLHWVICQTCRNVSEQLDFLRRAMRQIDRDRPEAPAPGDPDSRT